MKRLRNAGSRINVYLEPDKSRITTNRSAEMHILRMIRMTADHSWGMRLGFFFGGADTDAILDTTWNVSNFFPFHHIYQRAVRANLSARLYGLPLRGYGRLVSGWPRRGSYVQFLRKGREMKQFRKYSLHLWLLPVHHVLVR
jgi:hypothetical protein